MKSTVERDGAAILVADAKARRHIRKVWEALSDVPDLHADLYDFGNGRSYLNVVRPGASAFFWGSAPVNWWRPSTRSAER